MFDAEKHAARLAGNYQVTLELTRRQRQMSRLGLVGRLMTAAEGRKTQVNDVSAPSDDLPKLSHREAFDVVCRTHLVVCE